LADRSLLNFFRRHGPEALDRGHHSAATAIDIVRLDAWLTGTPLGETRTSHLARFELAA
jgi:hypothetical protein